MDNLFGDLLVGLIGCLAVGALALGAIFRRLGRRGRIILGAGLTLLTLVACLSTQLGAIQETLARQSSPSGATLVAYTTDTAEHVALSGLSAHDGSLLWRHSLDIFNPSGITAGGVVYLAGATHADGSAPVVEALRLRDGAPLWRLALPGARLTAALHVANGLLIAALYMDLAQTSIQIIAVSLSTHALMWRANIPVVSGHAEMATGAGLLFVGLEDGSVRALRLNDGGSAWTMHISAAPPSGQGADAGSATLSLGVVANGRLLIVYDNTGEVVSLRPADGATLWGRQIALQPYENSRATLTGSGLYLCADDTQTHSRALLSLDPATGATRWSHDANCAFSAPIASGANLYTLSGNFLAALHASDGALVWQGAPDAPDLGYSDLASDNGAIFAASAITNFRSIGFCADWSHLAITICHSTRTIAALNGATGQRYWRTNDGYDHLLAVG